jgi:pimeloyl-ACP methyl ester carboxylesterase
LTYVELGSGEPLILVHSAISDLRNWSQQIDDFAKRYRVIAYSQRYHYPNKATGKESDFTFDQNAADLLAVVKQLNLGKVHVIGHAYGGAVVVHAAIAEPNLFRSVAVMEPPFEALLPELQANAARYARNQIFSMVRKEILKRHNVEGAMHTFVDWSRTSGTWDALSSDGRQRYLDNGNALAAYSAHPEASTFSCDEGKKLTVPLLVVQGEASAPNHRIISSTLAECVAGAKRAVIRQAGHEMHRENAAEFNKAVLEFLSSVK